MLLESILKSQTQLYHEDVMQSYKTSKGTEWPRKELIRKQVFKHQIRTIPSSPAVIIFDSEWSKRTQYAGKKCPVMTLI